CVDATGVPRDKLEVTVEELGNMASATLGVQLARVRPALETGDRVLLVGLGGGVSLMTMVWGGAGPRLCGWWCRRTTRPAGSATPCGPWPPRPTPTSPCWWSTT